MAVVYFTSNASTGAGSLAEAVKNAQPGDIIRPDETVFERGSTIEIALASALTVGKNLTLDASPCRVRLDAGGAFRCAHVPVGVVATFTAFDFVNGYNGTTAGCVHSQGTLTLNRCGVYGGSATYGGGVFVANLSQINDCVVTGCRATSFGGGIVAANGVILNGSTVIGNVAGTSERRDVQATAGVLTARNSIVGGVYAPDGKEYSGSVVVVASSTIGFVASPPDNLTVDTWTPELWRSWDLRLLDDASPTPSPYRDSGDVDAASKYDLDGNFRGRKSEGVATRSPGAYETLQADLFWVGKSFPQEMVDAAPQNIRVANYRQTTGSNLYEADMTWEIPDGVSYSSILGQYSSNEGASWTNLGYVAKDATSRKATQLTPGKEYRVRLRGVFADGSYTAWSVITYASPLKLDGSDGEQSWELRLPSALSVVDPSFQTSAGWSTSRFATAFSDVAPQVGQTLFIGRDVDFNAPPSGRIGVLTVGGGTVLSVDGGTTTVSDLVAGIGAVLQGSPITGDRARLGDYFRAETSVFYTFDLTEVGASVYIGNHAAYYTVVSTAPTYGILQLLPSSARRPTLSGNYVCADFRVRANSNANALPVAVSGSATVRSTLFSLGTDATSQYFERFFDGPVTLKLQGDATVGVPSPTRETWADNFTVDVSEATSATLKLNGQTVYGDAPTCAVALTGSAKIDERGLDVASLTLAADATLNVDVGIVRAGALTVADGANVAFSSANAGTAGVSVDAVLTASESATVGNATFTGNGYFATPSETDLTAATFAETVRVVDYSAGVANFTATATGPKTAKLEWSATDATRTVCVERENAASPNGWETLALTPTENTSPLEVALTGKERFRIFDGATFSVDSAWSSMFGQQFVVLSSYFRVANEKRTWEAKTKVISNTLNVKAGQSVTILARISDAFDAEALLLNDGTNIISVSYSALKKTGSLSSNETPIDGHVKVAVPTTCVLEEPLTSDAWGEKYNFILTPNIREKPIFPTAGNYSIKIEIVLADGNPITFYVEIEVS